MRLWQRGGISSGTSGGFNTCVTRPNPAARTGFETGSGRRAAGARLAVLLVAAAAVAACSSPPADPDASFAAPLLEARTAKDAAFRSQPNRPVPPSKVDEFLPLRYFPPDRTWAVPASLKPAAVRTPLRIPTSTGLVRDMDILGVLEFTINGRTHSLAALAEAGTPPNRLFVPFTDLTSGQETYAGGRYLEIERSVTGIYVVDFNRAFHPFCYYNPDYDCPFPPPQNRLPIHVRAGERMADVTRMERQP